jgi:hypothetical protein
MSRPRVRGLSAGKRVGTARPIPDAGPWWAHPTAVGPVAGTRDRASTPAAPLGEAGRANRHEQALAEAAKAIQAAPDGAAVFAALGAAVESLGLNGHVATLDDSGQALVVRTVVLPWSALAEVERLLGGHAVGARLSLDELPPYRDALRNGRPERVEDPRWWARLAVPSMGPAEARAVGQLLRLGDVVLAPIATHGRAFGVLTIWSSELSDATVSTAELLGWIAGGALGALGWPSEPTP